MISNLLHNCLYTLDTKSKSINGQYTYIDRKIYHIFVLVIDFVSFVLIHILLCSCRFTLFHLCWFILFPLCWFTFCFICWFTFCFICVDSHFASFVYVNQHKWNKMWINTKETKCESTQMKQCESTRTKQNVNQHKWNKMWINTEDWRSFSSSSVTNSLDLSRICKTCCSTSLK
jgi:hypothetical protein